MKDKCFLDTNVFNCAIDTSPDLKEKRQVARHLIKDSEDARNTTNDSPQLPPSDFELG